MQLLISDAFHSHGEDVIEKLSSLNREATNTALPTDVESVKRLIVRLEDQRRSALESHRLALQDGESLIEQLTILKNNGSLDSRPGHILPAVKLGKLKRNFLMLFVGGKHLGCWRCKLILFL